MNRPQLVIGNKNYSSWSLRPWLVLKHMGIDFEEIRIPLFTASFPQAIAHYSKAGMVPVYLDGDRAVWESLAICEYLAEQDPSLWPEDPAARAVARSVSAEMHAGFGAVRAALPMNCRARGRHVALSPEVAADIRRIHQIWRDCREAYGGGGPWLFGGFSIADAMFAPVVSRFLTYEVAGDAGTERYMDTVVSNPHLRQWFQDAAAESETIEEEEVG